ncbi:NAD(P)-binding protein [Hypoxylon sp. NC1633]|nr:NAD(P)-binding protein [Hypoxylon sp. NC1633]
MTSKTVLISGANRGLGKAILELYLAKPGHTVIAANRNPEHPSSKALYDVPTGPGSRLLMVKIDASVESDASEAVKQLAAQGIDHLDLVIANAGIAKSFPKVSEVRIPDLIDHLTPNVFGAIWLFQATLPLLLKSDSPTWVTMGSGGARISVRPTRELIPLPNATYSPSKVAMHWFTAKMNSEEERLNAFVVNPGFCETDLGVTALKNWGLERSLVQIEESCLKLVQIIDGATKETHGGRFWNYTGEELTW